MRLVTLMSLICMAGALGGCVQGPGSGIDFVASNTDSVLLDFAASPPGQLANANDAAVQQCQLFHRSTAVLESLNTRGDNTIRATYLCRGGMIADISTSVRHRQ